MSNLIFVYDNPHSFQGNFTSTVGLYVCSASLILLTEDIPVGKSNNTLKYTVMKTIVDSKYCNDQDYIAKIIGLCDKSCDRFYRKQAKLFSEGTLAEGVLYIRSGKGKIVKTGPDHQEMIVRFVSEGDIIGLKSVITGENHSVSASAMEDMVVCFIPKDDFHALLVSTPELAGYLINCLSLSLQEAERRSASMIYKNDRQRLAEALLQISGKFRSDEIQILKNDLAGYTCLSRKYLTNCLRIFRESKLIALNSERIKILNINGLRDVANIPA